MIPDPREVPVLPGGVEEAGKILGLSRSAAYAAAERGEIPTIRLGRRLAVPTAQMWRMLGLDVEAPPAEPGAPALSLIRATNEERRRASSG